eukprot:CAMPEP_0168350278 /NCGR_PEP_ID=MMETSP0213-20121227/21011_1 /TAXON_ID=151035 /ORGANISM="Euplotes harpa, Strain FSP1.4" /LENGTH=126 /DNA_ID=CAMNT_0008360569 /DNA_START=253 /DNA_END=633 /DNA_ORIENTATION=+
MEKEVEQIGVSPVKESKNTGDDEPVMQEVFDRDYNLCTMTVQSTSKLKTIQKDIRYLYREFEKQKEKNKELKQEAKTSDNQSQLLEKEIEEVKKEIEEVNKDKAEPKSQVEEQKIPDAKSIIVKER